MELKRESFHIREFVADSFLERFPGGEIDIATQRGIFGGLEFKLSAYILSQPLCDVKITYPATWADAVRERFLPTWMRRWFPVHYNEVEIKAGCLASMIKVPPSYGPIPFMINNKRFFEDDGT